MLKHILLITVLTGLTAMALTFTLPFIAATTATIASLDLYILMSGTQLL